MTYQFGLIFLIIFVISFTVSSIPSYKPITGTLNESMEINVSMSDVNIIYYDYQDSVINTIALRIRIDVMFNHPTVIFVILKNDDNAVSFFNLSYHASERVISAEKTICSILNETNKIKLKNLTLSVAISSQSINFTSVFVRVHIIEDFLLKPNVNYTSNITEYSNSYFLFKFHANISMVRVKVDSHDEQCMVLSIQDSSCRMFDEEIGFQCNAVYQSIIKEGSIVIKNKNQFKDDQFFIVFMLTKNDDICHSNQIIKKNDSVIIVKEFNFQVVDLNVDYLWPVFGAIGFYLLFYLISPSISLIYRLCCMKKIMIGEEEVIPYSTEIISPVDILVENDTDRRKNKSYFDVLRLQSINNSFVSYDHVPDVFSDPNIYRLNKKIYLSDFSRKSSAILTRKYFLYLWYLIIVSVFYSLPVFQLVINHQQTFDTSGNQDTCYYNFKCTRPLFIFTAFNNVISNIGYVLLGILFTLITWRRDILYNEVKLCKAKKNYNHGTPQYYGLFYAMGISLMMEGIMSACYHICPSRKNFQFDTAYMYILACLCMTKIYQTRHPDTDATAHSFFMTIALIIFVGVIGVASNESVIFWVFFTIFYLVLCGCLTCELYYMGRWRLDLGLSRRIYNIILNDKWKFFIPTYVKRCIVLSIFNVANLALALYGAFTQPEDFPSFFLTIFMMNLMLYFVFYIVMKIIHFEHFHKISIAYIIGGAVCWGVALYCFINHPTDWGLSPAESREENQDCIFLNFYDIHDIWHFLSSMSMFFSFMSLQNIDDCLFKVARDKIRVF